MKIIDEIIDEIIDREDGYVNISSDKGGETNYGITVAVARENGYIGEMRDMPRSVAETIYERRYIVRPGFDRILAIAPDIGEELIDTGVNMGPHRAGEFLQRWLNAFNYAGKYQELFVDGQCGRITCDALAAFLAWRGNAGRVVLLRALNGLQAVRYLEITENDKTQRQFLFGWMSNRVQ